MVQIVESKKIKLLELLTNFHIGGTERQVANLALGIDASHFDLHLACLRHSGELLADLETLRVPRPEFPIGHIYSFRTLWQGIRLARYVRTNLIQIVHSYGFYPNIFTVPVARLAGASIVVAFSCKCRGSCPSCGARRMNQTAANLVDLVLPDQPVRQWVVSLPWDLRLPVARDSAQLTAVVRVVVSEIDKLMKGLGAERGVLNGATGIVAAIQYFGGSLNLNHHS